MPDISFPSNPSVNDTYSFGGKTWIWTGSYWALNTAGSINGINIGNITPATGAFTTLTSSGNTTLGNIAGNLLPAANITYNLGSDTQRWNDIYLANSTIYLGSGTISSTGANISLSGTTNVANIEVQSNVTIGDSSANAGNITVHGNATIRNALVNQSLVFQGSNNNQAASIRTALGNLQIDVDSTANVLTLTPTGMDISGTISATGNITGNYLLGNGSQLTGIDATSIQSGTSNVRVLSSGGNVSIGVGGIGVIRFTPVGIVNDIGNGVGNIGNSSGYFNTIFAKSTSSQYADLAEIYTSDIEYAAGTLVCFGGSKEITQSTAYAQMSLAGVVSTRPAYLMNSTANGVSVALQGRVPCRVIGKINKGDLVTSSNRPGVATRLDPQDWVPGSVIGKALENYDSESEGTIEVVVGRT